MSMHKDKEDFPIDVTPVDKVDYENRLDSFRNDFTPLHDAVFFGDMVKLRQMISDGADVNIKRPKNSCTPLHVAAQTSNLEACRLLIQAGANIHCQTDLGYTPLNCAISASCLEVFLYLKEAGCDIYHKSKAGVTVLHTAAYSGNCDILEVQLREGVDIEEQSESGQTALQCAASRGQLDAVKYLVERGANIQWVNGYGQSVIVSAVKNGHTEIVKYLLENGAQVNLLHDENCMLPIHYAALHGYVDICQLLIKYGVNPLSRTPSGNLPVHMAAKKGHTDVVKYFLENTCTLLSVVNRNGQTLLDLAVESNSESLVEYLINKGMSNNNAAACGVKFNFLPVDKLTLFIHRAAMNGNVDMCQLLIKHGANPTCRNTYGYLPVQVAAAAGHIDVVKYFLENTCTLLSVITRKKQTLLHLAASSDNESLVKYLVNKGISINATDINGLTPLHVAAQSYSFSTARALLQLGSDSKKMTLIYQTPLDLARRRKQENMVQYIKKF